VLWTKWGGPGWLVTAQQALVMVSSEGGAFKFSCGINFHDFKDPWGQDFTPPFDVFGEFATWEIVWQPTFVQWNLRGQQVGVVPCTLWVLPTPSHMRAHAVVMELEACGSAWVGQEYVVGLYCASWEGARLP
jgi:hypothetical protein